MPNNNLKLDMIVSDNPKLIPHKRIVKNDVRMISTRLYGNLGWTHILHAKSMPTHILSYHLVEIIFFMMHSMSVLSKKSIIWLYIEYSVNTHLSILWIKGCQLFINCTCDVTK